MTGFCQNAIILLLVLLYFKTLVAALQQIHNDSADDFGIYKKMELEEEEAKRKKLVGSICHTGEFKFH